MPNQPQKASKSLHGTYYYYYVAFLQDRLKLILLARIVGRQRKRKVKIAKPIHMRRVEEALNLNNFLTQPWVISSDSDDDVPNLNDINIENVLGGKAIKLYLKLF